MVHPGQVAVHQAADQRGDPGVGLDRRITVGQFLRLPGELAGQLGVAARDRDRGDLEEPGRLPAPAVPEKTLGLEHGVYGAQRRGRIVLGGREQRLRVSLQKRRSPVRVAGRRDHPPQLVAGGVVLAAQLGDPAEQHPGLVVVRQLFEVVAEA
ncbi:hypothetical protein [Dactylosporangium sp. NPDC049140]|uniref:hypothetical protein n=1 Tax=Dactylosporangium sp. NPDC049140 TaxID=3155647 RepID=UPI0033DC815B